MYAIRSYYVFSQFFCNLQPEFTGARSWRGAGVAELARLESVCTSKVYRGFESLSLRSSVLCEKLKHEKIENVLERVEGSLLF